MWVLNDEFTLEEEAADACIATGGEVPAGEAGWKYCDHSLKDTDGTMGKWVERALTVAELKV